MTLPTFLGIGVPKAGTTWLHNQLSSHPYVYVPTKCKEVHFFDQYYGKGLRWYENFFPQDKKVGQYQAIGEITPHYLYCTDCPERIAKTLSAPKLVAMLRNPVERAFSHYWFRVRLDNYTGSFEEFLRSYPKVIEWGFYSQYLKNYFRIFSRSQMLILIYEHVFHNVEKAKSVIGEFLEIKGDSFPRIKEMRKDNPRYLPRFRRAYALSRKMHRYLRERDFYLVINVAKKLGAKRLFGERTNLLPMEEDTREYLKKTYTSEIAETESLLDMDLSCWKQP